MVSFLNLYYKGRTVISKIILNDFLKGCKDNKILRIDLFSSTLILSLSKVDVFFVGINPATLIFHSEMVINEYVELLINCDKLTVTNY
ncbi:hypothetical protein GCM10023142_30020 [Anaerocolumna aminovalerica]|jgi:hypothetical protein